MGQEAAWLDLVCICPEEKKSLKKSPQTMNNHSDVLYSGKKKRKNGDHELVVEDRKDAARSNDVFVLSALSLS